MLKIAEEMKTKSSVMFSYRLQHIESPPKKNLHSSARCHLKELPSVRDSRESNNDDDDGET